MFDQLPIFCVLLISALSLYKVYRMYTRISIAHIRGPKSPGFWIGDLRDILTGEVGDIDFDWQEQFGNVVRYRGPFMEDRLWVSDPKALQHILQSSGYDYPKPFDNRLLSSLGAGFGILTVDGDDHKRHKKIMLPAFGIPEAKNSVPWFRDAAEKIVMKMSETIANGASGKSAMIDVYYWLTRATLDGIGAAAFDYNFGAIDGLDNELTKSYNNLLLFFFGSPTPFGIFVRDIGQYVPNKLLNMIYSNLPGTASSRMRRNRDLVYKIARDLIRSKSEDLQNGKQKKDIMSILVKANGSEDEGSRLKDDEVLDQMRTIMITGHETTANSLSWTLYELAKYPHVQDKLRAEIRELEAKVQARENREFTAGDIESMPYIVAVTKETLRINPVAFQMTRESAKDDVLPLSKPITTASGEVVNEIPVPKGMKFMLSIPAYNRNKDIWGEDAHEFNPDRWLSMTEKKEYPVGVYGNLLSFSGGVRSCIGWRMAVIELQTLLVTLVSNLEFSLDERTNIKRVKSGIMTPVVDGEEGCQMPLRVCLASRT